MDSDVGGLTIEELAERYGVRPRTIHFYITKGLLPSPGSRGRSVRYGEEYQIRLQLIVLRSRRHLPLAEIKESLSGRSLDDLRQDLAREEELARHLRAPMERQAAVPPEAQDTGEASVSPRDFIGALLRQAQQVRPAMAQPRAAPAPPVPTSGQGAARLHEPRRHMEREQQTAAAWRRWELAPGVELHVREDAARRHGDLIERVLRAADEAEIPDE